MKYKIKFSRGEIMNLKQKKLYVSRLAFAIFFLTCFSLFAILIWPANGITKPEGITSSKIIICQTKEPIKAPLEPAKAQKKETTSVTASGPTVAKEGQKEGSQTKAQEDSSGVLGNIIHAIGKVLAFPFRLMAGLIQKIF